MNACGLASQSTKMAAFLWTAKKTDILIDLYEKKPCHKAKIFLLATIFMIRTKCCMQLCCNVVHAKITCNMLHVTNYMQHVACYLLHGVYCVPQHFMLILCTVVQQ